MYDISSFGELAQAAALTPEGIEPSFNATSYIVHLGNENIVLRIGEYNQRLDTLLEEANQQTWAWITAANPGAQQVSEKVNAARFREMLALVSHQKLKYLAADAVPDSPGWPIEPGLFIFGIPLESALDIGRQFGQLAILAGSKNRVPQLHYCDVST